MKVVGAIAALSMLAGLAVACSDDDDEPTESEEVAAFCSDLEAMME